MQYHRLILCVIFNFLLLINLSPASADSVTADNSTALSHRIKATLIDDISHRLKSDKFKDMNIFYQLNNYQPLWTCQNGWTIAAKNALTALKNAHLEGLEPIEYQDAEKLQKIAINNIDEQLKAELAFCHVVLCYLNDLHGARLHPSRIDKELYVKPEVFDAGTQLYKMISHDPHCAHLINLTIPHPQYQALKKLLRYFIDAKQHMNGAVMPTLSKTALQKGDSSQAVIDLRKLLIFYGYLKQSLRLSMVFDEQLESTLKLYQQNNGLSDDGVVGERTIRVLNKTPQEYIDQIAVTMERWRWLPADLGQRYALVNIPAFEIKAYNQGHEVIDMPIIVGQNYRHTPVFTSKIDSITFNPIWHVPVDIILQDKLPILKHDPENLIDKGYILRDEGGAEIDPMAVNWSVIQPTTFKYHLEQLPGAQNALGKIRFNMPNPFSIFLHSTSQQELFDKRVRNISSGCIRLKYPDQMAAFVLDDELNWSIVDVNAAMQGDEPRQIIVSKPLNIHVAYFTVWIDQNNVAHFYDDIYGQDTIILNALHTKNYH